MWEIPFTSVYLHIDHTWKWSHIFHWPWQCHVLITPQTISQKLNVRGTMTLYTRCSAQSILVCSRGLFKKCDLHKICPLYTENSVLGITIFLWRHTYLINIQHELCIIGNDSVTNHTLVCIHQIFFDEPLNFKSMHSSSKKWSEHVYCSDDVLNLTFPLAWNHGKKLLITEISWSIIVRV